MEIFVEGPGPTPCEISKGPKQILEGPSIEISCNFFNSRCLFDTQLNFAKAP